ncbi:MAG: polyprenyl synthetase family protein [Candidatus Bathyarchaeia archaeon]|jgi:geranylgeranyl pyrophosphate synthase|nr:hypothetical protein [Candidatus Bathyarchaeota archaeon A05DMB-4]MDH7595956.1 polyprenyl synthetase family protein [Candidatus Bathyarchaeota archaeon]
MTKTLLTAQQVVNLLSKYGKKSFATAQKIILKEKIHDPTIHEALNYFITETWHDLEHPGFMAITCEAVGGKPEKTTMLGAALILLRGAMDVHDDIIDQQTKKAGKLTVFGKYGRETAILVGDILFFEGLIQLNKATSQLPKQTRNTITNLVKNALFEVGTGTASEVNYKGNFNLPPKDLMKILKQKSAAAEMHARLGAIVGGGNKMKVDALGRFGRIFGLLTMIRDEFIDIYEPDELQNRKEKDCLPLPLLLTLQDENTRNSILKLLSKRKLTEKDTSNLIEVIFQNQKINHLKKQMKALKKKALSKLNVIENRESAQILASLLDPILEDL